MTGWQWPGASSLDEKAKELEDLIDWGFSQMRQLDVMSFFPRMKWARLFLPHKVLSAPCQQVVDHDPDLSTLPVLTCWPGDGGLSLHSLSLSQRTLKRGPRIWGCTASGI